MYSQRFISDCVIVDCLCRVDNSLLSCCGILSPSSFAVHFPSSWSVWYVNNVIDSSREMTHGKCTGTACRYYTSKKNGWIEKFPIMTFAVNVVGCIVFQILFSAMEVCDVTSCLQQRTNESSLGQHHFFVFSTSFWVYSSDRNIRPNRSSRLLW